MDVLIVILFSYLSGSIPFGLILTKIFGDQDIRNIGSGNFELRMYLELVLNS